MSIDDADTTALRICDCGGTMAPWNASRVYRDATDVTVLRCTGCGKQTPVMTPTARTPRQVAIVGPSGAVHYRRPEGHPMIEEARRTPGYSVRFETDVEPVPGDRPLMQGPDGDPDVMG